MLMTAYFMIGVVSASNTPASAYDHVTSIETSRLLNNYGHNVHDWFSKKKVGKTASSGCGA